MKSKKKSKSTKLPAFQFYPGDWMKDPGIRSLSIGARGLWFEMICLMWEADNRGFLMVGSTPVDAEMLARMSGITRSECDQSLSEMEKVNIYSKCEETGALYCRRMVKDEDIRLAKSRAGMVSGEQRRNKSRTESKNEGNTIRTKRGSSSSSSSSVSSSTSIDTYSEKCSGLSPQMDPSPSLDGGDQSLDWSPPSLKSDSKASIIASAYIRRNPGIISQDKATKQVEFYLARGMKATEAEAAVSKPSAKGKHIWDLFKPITPIQQEEEIDHQAEVFKMFIEDGNKPKAKRGAK